jgi:glycosyltransferase involved in cell wall biosynthesis
LANNKQVLFLSYDGMTDPLGQSQVLPYLSGLRKKGYEITLVSFEKPERASQTELISQICAEQGIDWQPLNYTRKPPVLSTMKDVRAMKKTAQHLHLQKNFDLVHCRSYIAALAGLWMKKKFGIPFIFDMRGFWADERVDGGLWSRSNPIFSKVYDYFKGKEKQFLEQSAAIVSLTHAAADEIGNWPLARHTPIDVIPCCVDTKLFDPGSVSPARQKSLKDELDIPEETCVLGYVGSLGTWYQLPEMLQFFRVWKSRRPDSLMLFVTTEPASMILEEADRQGLDASDFRIVSAGRKEVPVYLSLMDYGLFFLKQAFSKMASSPVKQGEMMAMGIPVICNAGVGDSDRIVTQYQAGVLVKDYSDADFEAALDELQTRDFDPAAIREGCLDYFDLQQGVERYAGIYERLTAPVETEHALSEIV